MIPINQRKYNTLVSQAKTNVPGFKDAYALFVQRVSIDQKSKSLISNYGRSLDSIALHFGKVPHQITVEEINAYLYRMTVHEKLSASYFKQVVYGLRHWFRVFGMEEQAIAMPSIKKEEKLPVVLSKEECKVLFYCTDQCPVCKRGRMICIMAFDAHGPPTQSTKPDITIKMKKAM
jgi:integrase/recombinase XerD